MTPEEWELIVRMLRRLAAELFHDEVEGVTMHLRHVGKARLPFPFVITTLTLDVPAQEDETGADTGTLTPTQQAVMDALRGQGDVGLKGSAIARRAGKRYNGHFRGVLAEMVTSGLLEKVDDEGYRIRPASAQAEEDGADS